MDHDEVQNRFADAPDLEGVRASSTRPSPARRVVARLKALLQVMRNPTFVTAFLALLILAAIFVGIQVIP
ncbi:MAG: hypothetical protein R3258_03100 [Acidimicrobiia bacterium]|nr:hypothetical protein [Acidimicrobiia bacterium]